MAVRSYFRNRRRIKLASQVEDKFTTDWEVKITAIVNLEEL